jgi:hypothetical protein
MVRDGAPVKSRRASEISPPDIALNQYYKLTIITSIKKHI